MKRITKPLIEKHLGPQRKISRTPFGTWVIELQSGASVKISRRRIDFGKYRDIKNRTGIVEELFQEEAWNCLELGQEFWGGIRIWGMDSREEYATFLRTAEEYGINTGDQGLILRHFGKDATVKYGRFGGYAVNLPNGSSVKITGSAIETVTGGGDMFRSALMMLHELVPDNVVVRGKPAFVLMGMNHGKALNIEVIPESDLAMFYGITGAVAQLICIGLALCWLDLGAAVIAGYITGLFLCVLGSSLFWRQIRAMARKRGRAMLGLETTDNDTRKASIADAKAKGML